MLTRHTAAHHLEEGTWNGVVGRALASVFGPVARRTLVRPGSVPDGVAVVCVGGATLGGSGKTRVAIACARELAAHRPGSRVVLVSHGYRGMRAGGAPRVVHVADSIDVVGDEAIVCARALAGRATVVVGGTRQAAIDHAVHALRANVIVLDGPLRIARASRSISLLALDAREPWGAGRVVPAGDLRAPIESLRALADREVIVDAAPSAGVARTIRAKGDVGLFTALARPRRLIEALSSMGISPRAIVSISDHGPLDGATAEQLRRRDDVSWIATDKCALHLEHAGIAHDVIPDDLHLDDECRALLAQLGERVMCAE